MFNSNQVATSVTRSISALCLTLFSVGLPGCASLSGAPSSGYPAALERQEQLKAADAAAAAQPEAGQPDFPELMRQADAQRDQGRVADAAVAYIRALGLEPEHSAPRERLAFMQLDSDPARAQAIFEDLLQRDPSSAEAYTGLGLAQLSRGDLGAARDSLERALAFGATSTMPATALGVIHDRLGDHETAKRYYRTALEADPTDPDLLNNLGTSQLVAGDVEAALETFRQAQRRAVDDKVLLNNLGLAYGRLQRYDESRQAFEQADRDAALNNLAYVYFVGGDYKAAIALCEQALVEGRGEREMVLRNLFAAQTALYSESAEVPTQEPAAAKRPVRRAARPADPAGWLQ